MDNLVTISCETIVTRHHLPKTPRDGRYGRTRCGRRCNAVLLYGEPGAEALPLCKTCGASSTLYKILNDDP